MNILSLGIAFSTIYTVSCGRCYDSSTGGTPEVSLEIAKSIFDLIDNINGTTINCTGNAPAVLPHRVRQQNVIPNDAYIFVGAIQKSCSLTSSASSLSCISKLNGNEFGNRSTVEVFCQVHSKVGCTVVKQNITIKGTSTTPASSASSSSVSHTRPTIHLSSTIYPTNFTKSGAFSLNQDNVFMVFLTFSVYLTLNSFF